MRVLHHQRQPDGSANQWLAPPQIPARIPARAKLGATITHGLVSLLPSYSLSLTHGSAVASGAS